MQEGTARETGHAAPLRGWSVSERSGRSPAGGRFREGIILIDTMYKHRNLLVSAASYPPFAKKRGGRGTHSFGSRGQDQRPATRLKTRTRVKDSGQECPLHTSLSCRL